MTCFPQDLGLRERRCRETGPQTGALAAHGRYAIHFQVYDASSWHEDQYMTVSIKGS